MHLKKKLRQEGHQTKSGAQGTVIEGLRHIGASHTAQNGSMRSGSEVRVKREAEHTGDVLVARDRAVVDAILVTPCERGREVLRLHVLVRERAAQGGVLTF